MELQPVYSAAPAAQWEEAAALISVTEIDATTESREAQRLTTAIPDVTCAHE